MNSPYKMGVNEYVNNIPLKLAFGKNCGFNFAYTVMPPAFLSGLCAEQKLDISSVSFWAYKAFCDSYELLPNFCISCSGAVKSVKIASQFRLKDISKAPIYVTNESGSSSRAFALYCKKVLGFDLPEHTTKDPSLAKTLFLIGDAALRLNAADYPYCYDFGELFYDAFKMPMVYGAIAVKKELYANLKEPLCALFNKSLEIFEGDKTRYIQDAVKIVNSPQADFLYMKEYFGNFRYKISDVEFERAKNFVFEK